MMVAEDFEGELVAYNMELKMSGCRHG